MSRLSVIFSLLLVVLVCLVPSRSEAEEKPEIAVIKLRSRGGAATTSELLLMTDRVHDGVLENEHASQYVVLSRESMKAFLEMNEVCPTGLDGKCDWEVGKLMGAAYVISGDVTQMEQAFLCSLKVHETNEGSVKASGKIGRASCRERV